jgi:hypothetical protein
MERNTGASMNFECATCKGHEEIPPNAIQIGTANKGHWRTFKFMDGSTHVVKRIPKKKQTAQAEGEKQ